MLRLTVLFFVFVLTLNAWTEQPSQPFLDALDVSWRAGEYVDMERFIENRLLVSEGDPQALVAGFYFHLIVSNDAEKARGFSDRILSKAKAQGVDDPEWFSQFTAPLEEMNALKESAEEKEARLLQMKSQLSALGGKTDFVRLLIQANSKALGWKDGEYRKQQAALWEEWKHGQLDLVRELGDEHLLEWAKRLIVSHEPPVTLTSDKIPEVLRTTEDPRVRLDSKVQVRIELYKFVNSSYGYVISLNGISSSDDGFMSVQKITEHVGWYMTRG